MHHRATKDVQSEKRSEKNLHGTEHTSFTKSSSRKDTARMFTQTNFFSSFVLTKANTATGLTIHCKESVYIVDSGASLHMMGLCFLNHKEKKTTRLSSNILDIQTANGIVVSDTQAKIYIKELDAYLWIHLAKDSSSVLSLGRLCFQFGHSYSWPTEATPRLSKGDKVIESHTENFVTMFAMIEQKAVPSIEFSTAKRNLERENEVEDTMLDLLQPFTEGIQERDAFFQLRQLGMALSMKLSKIKILLRSSPRLPPIRGEILWQRYQE